jgi:hypothetical protein
LVSVADRSTLISAGVLDSAPEDAARLKATSGRLSSLVIVTVALNGVPTVYAVLALRVTITVSSLSTTVSSIGATVIVALAAPAGMVTLVPILV